jgi:hypothetical protein
MSIYVGSRLMALVIASGVLDNNIIEVRDMPSEPCPEPCQPPRHDLVNETPAYRQRYNRHTGVAKAKRQAKKGKRK